MGVENGGGSPESERQIKVQVVAEGLKKANFLRPNEEEKDKLDDRISEAFGYLKHGVESVAEIDGTIADFETKGDKSSFTETQIENLRADREILADAVTIACRDLTATDPDLESEFFLGPKHIDGLLGEKLTGLGNSVSERKGIPKEIGAELDKLEMMRRKMKGGNTAESKAYVAILKKKIDAIAEKDFDGQFEVLMVLNGELEKYEGVSDSERKMAEAAEKMSRAAEEMKTPTRLKKKGFGGFPDIVSDGDDPNPIAMAENRFAGKEYTNPYVVPYYNYVDSIFDYNDPRLYFTPPPEWVEVLPEEKQLILKVAQKLARGIMTKLATKDIDFVKPRQNEVYNFPMAEFKLLYEKLPGFREGMEAMIQELMVIGKEDGCMFLRIKDDPETLLHKLGDFETYKKCLYRRLALKNNFGIDVSLTRDDGTSKTMAEIKAEIDGHIKPLVDAFKRENKPRLDYYNQLLSHGYSPEMAKKMGGWSEIEAERQWEYKNTYVYKEGVALATDFVGVSMVFESADWKRNLKPSQITADKVRTMMMPLEKFLQKSGFVSAKDPEFSEAFGGDVGTVLEEMARIKGDVIKNKLLEAAYGDRSTMRPEVAKWRVFPKRQFCSFFDMYIVNQSYDSNGKAISGSGKTLAEAAMAGERVIFPEGNEDLDIFVNFRDIWDEVLTVTPFVIGKGEFKGVPKLSAPGVKEGGVVRDVKKIRKADGTGFINLPFVDYPEYYAWLLGNAIGLETSLDIPMLNQEVLGSNVYNYDLKVNTAAYALKLRPLKNDPYFRDRVAALTKDIFTAGPGWKNEIMTAFKRKHGRIDSGFKNQRSKL